MAVLLGNNLNPGFILLCKAFLPTPLAEPGEEAGQPDVCKASPATGVICTLAEIQQNESQQTDLLVCDHKWLLSLTGSWGTHAQAECSRQLWWGSAQLGQG